MHSLLFPSVLNAAQQIGMIHTPKETEINQSFMQIAEHRVQCNVIWIFVLVVVRIVQIHSCG